MASLCTETTETSSSEASAAEEQEYSASASTLHKEPIFSTPKRKILKDTYNYYCFIDLGTKSISIFLLRHDNDVQDDDEEDDFDDQFQTPPLSITMWGEGWNFI